jgi:multidrug efflux system membrane fusion protein
MSQSAYARKFTVLGVVLALLIVGAALMAGSWYVQRAEQRPMSDEAVIKAHVVNIAATVGGKVITLAVRDNQRVTKGDLLFALDPEPYKLAVEQTRADLRIAEAELAAQRRAISAEQSNAVVANEQVNRAQQSQTR